MSNGRGKHKSRGKRRTHKISDGIHGGGGKTILSEVQKALLGGGVIASLAAKRKRDR